MRSNATTYFYSTILRPYRFKDKNVSEINLRFLELVVKLRYSFQSFWYLSSTHLIWLEEISHYPHFYWLNLTTTQPCTEPVLRQYLLMKAWSNSISIQFLLDHTPTFRLDESDVCCTSPLRNLLQVSNFFTSNWASFGLVSGLFFSLEPMVQRLLQWWSSN